MGTLATCEGCTAALYALRSPFLDEEGQRYLFASERLSADLARLLALWDAEERAAIWSAKIQRDDGMVSLVLAYRHPHACCFACKLGWECRWHPWICHTTEEDAELDELTEGAFPG